jgi:hypothetical protein
MYAEEWLKAEIGKDIIAKKWLSQLGNENWLAGPRLDMTLAFEWPVMCFLVVPPAIFINQRWLMKMLKIEGWLNRLTTAYKRAALVCVLTSCAILKGLNGTISACIVPIGNLRII